MENQKSHKTPKQAKGISHAVALLKAEGIEWNATRLKKLLKENPHAQDDHGRVDMDAVKKAIISNLPEPLQPDELEEKEILERRKIRAQYLKEEFRLAVEQRKFVPIDEVRRDLIRIAAGLRSELQRFIGDVPNWEGIPAAEMSLRARKCFDALCQRLSDETSKLYAT